MGRRLRPRVMRGRDGPRDTAQHRRRTTMACVRRLEHVGIVVDDLEAATEFFLDLGLEREGATAVQGEWVDNIVGLKDVQADVVVVRTPDGSGKLELAKFHTPADDQGPDAA